MKTLITTLNSKFIHTSLSLRLLFVATKEKHDVDFKEYTIKDNIEHIVDDILESQSDIIAFSCYIWNIEYIQKVSSLLKQRKPHCIIIYGGPEVTYEPQYFLQNSSVDYIMSGEGEIVLDELLTALEKHEEICIPSVSYLNHISQEVACVYLSYI